MLKKLRDQIFHVGVFACIPAVSEEDTLRATEALVNGGMQGIILSWNKKLAATIEKIHARYPHLLIGAQGPYDKASQLFASGVAFIVDSAGVPAKIQVPFLLRQNNNLLDGTDVLAQCSGKIVFSNDIRQQKWDEITARAQQALAYMLGFELRHVGINHPDAAQADKTAGQFEHLFGFAKADKGGAYFAGPYIEAMKKMFYGEHGHIAIATNNAARAAWYLEQRGARFNWKSADYNADGTLRVVYLQDEIGGFAVHILQK